MTLKNTETTEIICQEFCNSVTTSKLKRGKKEKKRKKEHFLGSQEVSGITQSDLSMRVQNTMFGNTVLLRELKLMQIQNIA